MQTKSRHGDALGIFLKQAEQLSNTNPTLSGAVWQRETCERKTVLYFNPGRRNLIVTVNVRAEA